MRHAFLTCLSIAAFSFSVTNSDARGGFSSGGGRGGFSSSRSSFGGGGRSFSGGGFSSGRSFAAPTRSITRTTTVSRSYSRYGGSYYGHPYGGMPYYHSYGMYGGFGMGYGYSNGIIDGLIIGSLMHPAGTMMYSGPGVYSGNALLYPDGEVVNQQGYQVGTYQNGQFDAVQGGMVAQPAPNVSAQAAPQPAPVVVNTWTGMDTFWAIAIGVLLVFIFFAAFT